MLPLAQPPRKDDRSFDDWMFRLWKRIASTAGLAWELVDKTGSNLTDLVTRNHADLQNINTTAYRHITQDEYEAVIDTLGTCLSFGCVLSINADNTKFDIASGHLYFTDSYTNPQVPVFTHITYAGSTANAVTNLATQDSTYVSIDQSGVLYQTATKPIAGDTRDKILLGALVHTNRTSITSADSNTNVIGLDVPNCLADISHAVGIVNEGNLYSGNVTNTLRLNKSAGYFWQIGINWKNDKKNPNRIAAAASTGAAHLATWRNGTGGWVTLPKTDIIPNRYDDGTGGATTPSGVLATNKWQAIKIFYLPNSQLTGVEYGQVVYNSEAEAEANKGVPTTDNPALASIPFRGWILIRGGATDLNNIGDAVFIDAGKFGQLTSGAATGSSTTTLQGAYDNSTQPQITTSTTSGSVQIKRGSTADTDVVLEVLNGAGTAVLSVTGEKATLTAPILGTPTSGTLTNCIGLPIAGGGTGQTTAQAAMNAFAGAVTAGSYLRGNGTNVVMNTIQAADVPTLNQNTTGTAANVTGTVAIANGGTGQISAQAAIDALTNVAAATNEYVLTKDTATGNAIFKVAAAAGSGISLATARAVATLRI